MVRNGFLQALQVVSSIVLAQAITPTDYGAFAVAAALVGFARSVGDLGLGQSMLVRREMNEADLSTCAAVVLFTSISVGSLVTVAALGINAGLLSGTSAALLTAAYAGTLVVDAFRFGPIVRLSRTLRFREVAVATTAEALASYAIQIALLLLGLGIWALVLGGYARSIVGVIVYARLAGPIVRPRVGARLRTLVAEGAPYQGPIVLTSALGALLPLIVAAALSPRDLGLWAWSTILAVPVAQALVTIQSVLVPSLARLYEQYRDQFQDACDRSARLVALIAGACAGALFGLAPAVVEQIFGARWTGATGAVQATVLGVVPFALFQFLSAILASRGQAALRFKCALIASFASLASIYPLMDIAGVTGAAVASAVVGPGVDAVLLAYFAKVPLRRAGSNALIALVSIGAISLLAARGADSPAGLALASLSTGVAALMLIWMIDRTVLSYAWSLLRKQRPDQPAKSAS